jgi:hypothetical protein
MKTEQPFIVYRIQDKIANKRGQESNRQALSRWGRLWAKVHSPYMAVYIDKDLSAIWLVPPGCKARRDWILADDMVN